MLRGPVWLATVVLIVACERKTVPDADRKSTELSAGSSAWVAPRSAEAATTAESALPTPEGCEAAVAELVNALPQVKRELANAQREADQSHGRATLGGIGPNDADDGFIASIGIHTAGRFDERVAYGVDGKGTLSVSLSGEALSLPATVSSAARRACAR